MVGAGGRFFGSNPNYTASELKHLYSTAEVKWVIAEADHLTTVQEAWEMLHYDNTNLFIFDDTTTEATAKVQKWTTLLEHGEADWIAFDDEVTSKSSIACLMSTSGTTGLPKAAQFSHHSQVAGCLLAHEPEKPYEVRSSTNHSSGFC